MKRVLVPLAWLGIVLLALINVAIIVGMFLPREHVVSRTLALKEPPPALWQTINDHAMEAQWRHDVQSVERLPDRNGLPVWREHYKNGDSLTLETSQSVAPYYLVRTIADEKSPFSGSWEYEIGPDKNASSTLRITERGRVPNPLFRFVGKFIIGQQTTIERYLKSLAAKFNEPAKIF